MCTSRDGQLEGGATASAGGGAVAEHEVAIVTTRAPRGVSALVEEAVAVAARSLAAI